MDEIIINFQDGTKMEINKVYGVLLAAGQLTVLFEGKFGERDSQIFDDTLIKNYFVIIGEWK